MQPHHPSFLAVENAGPSHWRLDVTAGLSVGTPRHLFLFGGAGLAASIAAMEAATGRPAIWAAAQYLAFVRPPARLDLRVEIPVEGAHSSQARVAAEVGAKPVIWANGTFGSRPNCFSHQWPAMPHAAPPQDCPEMVFAWTRREDDLYGAFDLRVAIGRYGPARAEPLIDPAGKVLIWARSRRAVRIDAVLLAIIADFLPSAVASAVGHGAVANSLDNSLRIARLVETEWILCEVTTTMVAHGFGQAGAALFAQDGTLLATASQSVTLRTPD